LVEFFEDAGPAEALSGATVVPGQGVEFFEQGLAGEDGGGAHGVATEGAHEVVGLAGAEAEEGLDGLAVEEGGLEGGQGVADLGQAGVPTGAGGHERRIPRKQRKCAVAQNGGDFGRGMTPEKKALSGVVC
jgi:hypothetical protein